MSYFRSPQQMSPEFLNIGSPRSLRPRDDLQPPIPQFYPQTPQTVYVSAYSPGIRHDEPVEDSPPIQYVTRPRTDDTYSESISNGRRAGVMSGLVNRFRRIPAALAKHHSRESLHAQYRAEAEAMAAAEFSRHRGAYTVIPCRRESDLMTSQALSGIPETIAESEAGPLPAVYEAYDDGTTAMHHEQDFMQMPQPHIQPDYSDSQTSSKAESSNLPLPPKDTWVYYWAIILLLVHHIRNLPWTDDRIVDDYVPARDGRGGYGAQKPTVSWYKPRKRARDTEKAGAVITPPQLYVIPATPQSGTVLSSMYAAPVQPAVVIPSPYSDATTAIRPTRTPLTSTSGGRSMISPGASSHGLGRQELSYSWYSSSPQHFPWQHPSAYGSEMSTPRTHVAGGYFVPR
ncbi:hypothetical protein PHLGIDRAFT_397548 [Phlebiopsis gigantea 11061_1 CR5-6]|uniref:Uncharacterized protein n=1 Tax=Phlebiopsis gigantea (strain 11061_1 CR5-6) TaxID=745531 RepID=A0A0C3S6R0_PHLG1|nr:hypothetical protein PHLGIDRAFT_397548 [Phlebiopsis gigantea 11061_1 CR5-6]